MTEITADLPITTPPTWAVWERQLLDAMDQSTGPFLEHFTRSDGEFIWDDAWGGGSPDDFYEPFFNWPLVYLMGGADHLLALASHQWEVVTKQLTRLGTVYKEYGIREDQMHQSESDILFFHLCLADPEGPGRGARARRFAGFYLNEDPDAINYDPVHKIVLSGLSGSRGPYYAPEAEREHQRYAPLGSTMERYSLPFFDLPGIASVQDLADPEKARAMGQALFDRWRKGDTPTNLSITSLVTNAFILSGEEKYRNWVVEYTDAWVERARANNGLLPDNVGHSGQVGEYCNGKWYGGRYGWTFPHGFQFVADAMVIGGQSERLLTGAEDRLRWVREQVEMLLCHAIEDDDGRLLVPMKYADPDAVIEYRGGEPLTRPDRVTDHPGFNRKKQVDGWFEFRQVNPSHMAHVWADSLDPEDLEVARRTRDPSSRGGERLSGQTRGKDFSGEHNAWLSYLEGGFPDFPAQALQQGIDKVYAQLQKLRGELDGSETGWGYRPYGDRAWDEVREVTKQVNEMKSRPWTESVTHSYFQTYMIGRSTMATEALVQLTMGGPQPIYNGGLLKVPVRHFDAEQKRAGLPADVAALVSAVDRGGIDLTLANTHPHEERRLIVQAGAFAEHRFTRAVHTVDGADRVTEVNGEYVEFALGPGTVLDVRLGMERYCRQPSYQEPWDR